MYESFFGMEHTPFVRDVPPEKLYESNAFRETLGRLSYVADRQMFAVVTADPGCGKSTLIRRFYSELPKEATKDEAMPEDSFSYISRRFRQDIKTILHKQ